MFIASPANIDVAQVINVRFIWLPWPQLATALCNQCTW